MNQIIITGNLTKTPDRFATKKGESIAKFTVAVNDYNDEPVFLQCTAFQKLAENCLVYLDKGSKVLVNGKLTINKYEKDGKTYLNPEVICNRVEFLSIKESPKEESDLPFPEVKGREKQPQPTISEVLSGKTESPKVVDPNDDLPF